MESLGYEQREADDLCSGLAGGLSGEVRVPVLVGEPTDRELDLQRRLVRESLLRSA